MVQEADIQIDNDSYLIIVYGKDRDKVKVKPYKIPVKKSTTNLLNSVAKSNIANVALACFSSKIGQNIAGKALSNATLGRITSSVYDIMADGKINYEEVAEDFIGSCTNALDNAATDLGLPTPSSLYTALMPGGSGVISKDVVGALAKVMNKEDKEEEKKENQGDITIIKLKNITDDNENWGIEIPTRKTETGFEIATAINNNNKTKDFTILLTTNEKKGTNMYQIKNQLEELKKQKIPFDIYINDKDVYHQYKWTNCLFSNLDFSLNGRNSLNCSMSITEIPEWSVEFVKLENYVSTKSNAGKGTSGNKKSGIKSNNSSVSDHAKTAGKVGSQRIYTAGRQADDWLKRQYKIGLSPEVIANKAKARGYNYDTNDIKRFISQGWLTGDRSYTKQEITAIKDYNNGKRSSLPQSVIDKNTKWIL